MTDRDDRMHAVVGIAHEALLTHWPRLKDLLDTDREFLRARARVAAGAERWRREGRHIDFLLPEGRPLAEARELVQTRRDDLEPETIEFIDHSIRHRSRQRRRRMRVIAAATGTALSVVTAFAIFSFVERRDALEQKEIAVGKERDADTQRNKAKDQEKKAVIARDEARLNAYIAHMNLAQREWEDSHVARVIELLAGAEADLRGFEWFYWNRLRHSDLLTFKGHSLVVSGVAFSPDGHRIASCSWDRTVKIWDAAPARKRSRSRDTPATSLAWRSAPTAVASPRAAWIGRSRSGMPPPARRSSLSRDTPTRSKA